MIDTWYYEDRFGPYFVRAALTALSNILVSKGILTEKEFRDMLDAELNSCVAHDGESGIIDGKGPAKEKS